MGRAWRKPIAVNPIRNKTRAPSILVAIVEFGICANQTLTVEKSVFGVVRECRPIAIFSNKNRWGADHSRDASPKHPVGERITASDGNIPIIRPVSEHKSGDKRQLFVCGFVAKAGNRWKPLEPFSPDAGNVQKAVRCLFPLWTRADKGYCVANPREFRGNRNESYLGAPVISVEPWQNEKNSHGCLRWINSWLTRPCYTT